MNQPENMTLGSMIGKTDSGPEVPNKVPEKESSLSEKFSSPGRFAVLLAVLFSPWALASVRPGAQCAIMVLMLVGLGFWWFETAFHERKSQVFPYLFPLVLVGLLIGIFQVIPLPGFLIDSVTGRQAEIYRNFSGNPDSAVTISLDRERTWQHIRLLLIGICGLLLGCRFFRSKRDTILLMWAVGINGALIAFIGIIQKVMRLPYVLYDFPNPLSHFGPFVNKNNAAGYMLMSLGVVIGLIIINFTRPKNQKSPDVLQRELPPHIEAYYQVLDFVSRLTAAKTSLLLIAGMIACGVIATISRGGFLALFVGSIATLLIYGVARKPKNSILLFVPVFGLVLALIAWLSFGEELAKRFESVDVVNVADADSRLTQWRETWPAVGDMGPFGSGLGAYKNVHRLYRSSTESKIFVYAENQFFQAVVEAGWPGLVLFCLAWLVAFQCASLLIFKGNSAFSVGVGTSAIFIIFSQAASSCFDFGFYIGANLLLFSVLIGFICCHAQYLAGRLKSFSWLKFTTPNYLVQGIVLGLFAFGFLVFLDLFRMASMDSLMRPKSKQFTRENMDLERTDKHIDGLNGWFSSRLFRAGNAQSVTALNHFAELHLHRSRLGLFHELKKRFEAQQFGFDPDAVKSREQNAEEERANEIYWSLTDLQRVQENASYYDQSLSRSEAKEFLASEPIQVNLPIALRAFQFSKIASPLQPVVHLRIGEIKGALADIKIGSGDEDIERCLELAPANANFRLVAGVHYLQSDKPAAAVPHLKRYLELSPRKFQTMMKMLGGGESRSITYLTDEVIGLELLPDDPKMIYNFAANHMPKDSEFRPAVLKRAGDILDSEPHNQREFTILSGDIAYAQGNLEKAIESYRAALVSQPNDPETIVKLAKALIDAGKRQEALDLAEKIKHKSPAYNKIMKYLNIEL